MGRSNVKIELARLGSKVKALGDRIVDNQLLQDETKIKLILHESIQSMQSVKSNSGYLYNNNINRNTYLTSKHSNSRKENYFNPMTRLSNQSTSTKS